MIRKAKRRNGKEDCTESKAKKNAAKMRGRKGRPRKMILSERMSGGSSPAVNRWMPRIKRLPGQFQKETRNWGQEGEAGKGIGVTVALDNRDRRNKDFGGIWDLAGNSEDGSD